MRIILPLMATVSLIFTACNRDASSISTANALLPQQESSVTADGAGGRYRIYVTNEMSGDISVIEGKDHSVVSTFHLGKRPRGIRASIDGTALYVALSGSPPAPPGTDLSKLPPPDKGADGIGVIDAESLTVSRILRGYSDPEQLAISLDGSRLYVASEDTGMAVIANAQTGDVMAQLPVGGEPEGVTIRPDGSQVYMSSEEEHRVSVIDTGTNTIIASIPVGVRPRDIAFSPDGKTAYVSGELDASLTIIDVEAAKPIATVTLPGEMVRPMGVAVSPDGKRIYVATGRGGTVVAIDAGTRAVVGTVAVGERPWGIAISPDGKYLYTANGPSNDVSIVDTEKLELLGNIAVGNRPWGVAIAPWPLEP